MRDRENVVSYEEFKKRSRALRIARMMTWLKTRPPAARNEKSFRVLKFRREDAA